jgi:hypothetical protein
MIVGLGKVTNREVEAVKEILLKPEQLQTRELKGKQR